VNEYVGKQGITKHIDCIPCFKGSIAMLSLGEDWEMFFWPPGGGGKVVRTLPRRSVTVLSGEARERWSHEIPRRLSEPWGRRGRRVSMTFRKVVVPAAVEPAKGARGKRGKKQR
ncbi:MAG TPA: alpha-ketoglutarate-dependent dioxygenase AlkB, partial [Myxococcales bacterium]|nr:alpha-ketoglutarate-dependent dioxygenase AlkB [Myxococcales bacterium]